VEVAIDSSVLVALLDPRDIWRDQSLAVESALLDAGITSVYFDCVAAEAISAAARRLREKDRAAEVPALIERLNDRVPHENLTWILPDVPAFYHPALEIMRASSGELNFNDALISLACREREIPAIASFDSDFDRIDWLRRIAAPDDLPNG
jgi:predicted nucleic acid-binding protein